MSTTDAHSDILPHLFRQEYAKVTAVLCRHFGMLHLDIAEDIASDTFLKASEHWATYGIPDNPTAWLYTVARNKYKDYLKHTAIFENQIKEAIRPNENEIANVIDFSNQVIADSQLAMIFAVCTPTISTEAQICLALQILCGFSVEEIGNAFLTKTETIKKRLHRAKSNLRKEKFEIDALGEADIKSRLNTVLKTLYLLFNEGYFSKSNNQLIRKELCSEAVRLTSYLVENKSTNTPQVNALLALMCFQSSRLNARTDDSGEVILFDKQDRNLWDQTLIDRGNYHLVNACSGNEITTYHLEAGIAYWHTSPPNRDKWKHILQLYNQILVLEYSPMTALNRAFAFSKIYGHKKAVKEVLKLDLTTSNFYHALLGYLYASYDRETAIQHYANAIDLTKSKSEQNLLKQEIARLRQSS